MKKQNLISEILKGRKKQITDEELRTEYFSNRKTVARIALERGISPKELYKRIEDMYEYTAI